MRDEKFNPIDFGFTWTADWYDWDSANGHELAKKARDERARELRRQGFKVKKSTHAKQLISRGGIGSGHPHVEFWVNVYRIFVQE